MAEPTTASEYLDRGCDKDDQKDSKGAIEDYTKAIELNPTYAEAYANRGCAKEESGDIAGAIADWEKAESLGDEEAAQWAGELAEILDKDVSSETTEDVANKTSDKKSLESDKYEIWKNTSSEMNLIRQKEKGALHGNDLIRLLELHCGRDPDKLTIEAGYLTFQGRPASYTFFDAVREATGKKYLPKWFDIDIEDEFGGELQSALQYFEIEYASAKSIISRLVKKHCPQISEDILYERTTQLLADHGYYDSVAHLHAAESKLKEGDYKSAMLASTSSIEAYATERGSDNTSVQATAYNVRAIAKYSIQDYHGAIDDFNTAISIELIHESEHDTAYYNRGIAKKQLSDMQGACEDWKKSAALGDEDATNLLEIYNQMNTSSTSQLKEQGVIEKLKSTFEMATISFDISYDVFEIDLHNRNIDMLTSLIDDDPEYVNYYCYRAQAKDDLGDHQGAILDYKKAIDIYNKAIDINPKDADAYNNRGCAKQESGDYQGAIEDYNKAVDIDSNNAYVYSNRGEAKQEIGDLKGACEDWKKAAELGDEEAAKLLEEHCQ